MCEPIYFNKSPVVGEDLRYVEAVVESGITHGDCSMCQDVEDALSQRFAQASAVLLTSSCTHALELIASLLDLKPQDEVIVPSYTFCTSAGAFYGKGCKIVFADSEVPSMNIDAHKVEALITKNTKALLVVHYAGLSCDMDVITDIVRRHNIILIEDNAHGFLGAFKGKALGLFGDFSTLSFHGTKNFSCGEGGALVINNSKYLNRAKIIREKGTNRSDFKKGKISKYEWIDQGSSYVMSEISAAILKKQLEHADEIQSFRKSIWEKYRHDLEKWANFYSVLLPPQTSSMINHASHAFHMIFPSAVSAQNFITYMTERNISVQPHYTPLHSSPIMRAANGLKKSSEDLCYNSTLCSERLIRLPLYYGLNSSQVERVIKNVQEFTI